MSFTKITLFPLSIVYGIAVGIRNFLFNVGILKSKSFSTPVICVGNITVGGTGKTPHTEFILSELKKDFRVACLSRGYKRKTSGYILADAHSTAEQIGDEPLQIKRKFNDVTVACDEKRVRGIEHLEEQKGAPQVIVLDDAFQHRYVKAGKYIVLIDYNRPVYHDHLLPMGQLRESTSALQRADYLIVTKCPEDLSPIDRRIMRKHLKVKPYQKLYLTTMRYGSIKSIVPGTKPPELRKDTSILCITGIAQPTPYIEHLESFTPNIKHLSFPDHHHFTAKDIRQIEASFQAIPKQDKYVFTTEKDAMRLMNSPLSDELKKHIFYIPIEIAFLDKEEKLIDELKNYVRKNQK